MGSVLERARTWLDSLSPRRRLLTLCGGGFVLIMIFDYVVAQILVGGMEAPSKRVALARLGTIPSGQVLVGRSVHPKKVNEPEGMAWRKAGVAVLARSEVDQVRTASGLRRAADGSALLAFTLGDWECEESPCEKWDTLKTKVVIDGSTVPLPDGGDTFVASLPPGTTEVALMAEADGYRQVLPLMGGVESESNIALLSREKRDPKTPIGDRFRLVERTSIPLQSTAGLQNAFTRAVTVDYWQRRFFLNGQEPANPGRMFLVVNAFYSYVGGTNRYLFADDEVSFVGANGKRYAPIDVDPSPEQGLLGFEVPAKLKGGTLELGGQVQRTSTTGVTYTAAIGQKSVPLAFD